MTCSAGACRPTGKNAVLNVNDLSNMLSSSDVSVKSGRNASSIEVASVLAWTTTNRLTLDSGSSVTINAPVIISGGGGLALATNDGGSGGMLSFGGSGYVAFWSGTGSLAINGNTYTLVKDIPALVSAATAQPSGFYALTGNYDATELGIFKKSPVTVPFTGTFNGLGNTISNLQIRNRKQSQKVGLFSSSSGTIADLRMSKANVFGGDSGYIGSIVGKNSGLLLNDVVDGAVGDIGEASGGARVGVLAGSNSGTVRNSAAIGTAVVGFLGYVGGLVGDNAHGVIDGSHASTKVTVSGSGYPGGLVSLTSGIISNSYATGNVGGSANGTIIAGGLAASDLEGGTITNSFATGAVTTGESGTAGGLVAGNDGAIIGCYATGAVSDGVEGGGAFFIGGLVAVNSVVGSIANSYARGAATGYSDDVGGLAGENDGTIAASYSTGQVTSLSTFKVGGLVGYDKNAGIADGYWDTDTSGIADLSRGAGSPLNDQGIAGLTTKQLRSGLPPGFAASVWRQNKHLNDGLPYLVALPPR